MKDLEKRDIFPRKNPRLAKLSVYRGGEWLFSSPVDLKRVTEDQSFYLISEKFGLVNENINNPGKPVKIGVPGDYVAVDRVGVMSLVTEAEFKMLFPAKKLSATKPLTSSEALKDPNFLTNIVKDSKK